MTQEEKNNALRLLHNRLCEQFEQVMAIEPRLGDYLLDIQNNSGLIDGTPDHHNAYEILGALMFLRLLRTYQIDIETFQDVIFTYEGR
jgi:hypothetical protein